MGATGGQRFNEYKLVKRGMNYKNVGWRLAVL